MTAGLRFGVFIPPYHNMAHNVSWAIERDLELSEWLDRLGFHSVWYGEHHSGGYETIPCPELMIAAAAQRTKQIKLCTGVISLPYHHPLMVADRIAYLDQMTRGRCVFGFGPGALPRDSHMMGMEYTDLRPRMEDALDAILELLDSDELVSRKTEWFELREAEMQIRSYTKPRLPISVAAAVSPSGPRLAGKYGLGLLSIAASSERGFEALADTWAIVEEEAKRHEQTVSRENWALVGMMHIAETEEQARREVAYGLRDFFRYHHVATPQILWTDDEDVDVDEMVDRVNASGAGVIGTPEMAIAQIERMIAQTGGFGEYLFFANEWGSRESMLRMYELFAREVMPYFDGSRVARRSSFDYFQAHHDELVGKLHAGWQKAQESYEAEQKARG
jgi:limonene 1,2-monooxygenase